MEIYLDYYYYFYHRIIVINSDIDSPKVSKDFPLTKQYPKNYIFINVSRGAPNHNNTM